MDNIYKTIEECNSNKKHKLLILFDMTADMLSNKNRIVTEIFFRGRKLNTSLVFITQPCFAVTRNVKLNSHYFIMKIQSK